MKACRRELQPSCVNGMGLTSDRMSKRLPDAAAVLRRENVVYVRVTYRGEWDAGTIDDPQFYDASTNLMNPMLTSATRLELRMFFRELLELRYPGWQNAEGSRGEFEWEMVRDTVTHIHGWRHFVYDYKTLDGL